MKGHEKGFLVGALGIVIAILSAMIIYFGQIPVASVPGLLLTVLGFVLPLLVGIVGILYGIMELF